MTSGPVRILSVTLSMPDVGLEALMIDYPKEGARLDGPSFEIVGWAVGRRARVDQVELVESGMVVARAAMRPHRDDVARLHSDSPQGNDVSFLISTPPLTAGAHELSVRAVLADGSTASIGSLQLTADPPVRSGDTLILLYHRVMDVRSETWGLSVSPPRFEEQMEALKRLTTPIPLGRLAGTDEGQTVPEPSVVVTFDDGYADNYVRALPILERHGIPATLFLATGFVGQEREFWWDQLDRILLEPGSLPDKLRVRAAARAWEWDLGEDALYEPERALAFRNWRPVSEAPTRRHSIYRSLWELMLGLSERDRTSVVEQLNEWSGVESGARPTHRALTWEETRALARSPLVEIGAHTVTHPALSQIPREAQRKEIEESKSRLEALLGHPVVSFAYPYGTRAHYSSETIELLRQCGFTSACANFPALVARRPDPYQLPRYIVPDVDGDRFSDLLRRWLELGDAAGRPQRRTLDVTAWTGALTRGTPYPPAPSPGAEARHSPRRMRVHIVCYEELEDWILGKIARRLHAELGSMGMDATLGRTADPSAEINHHIVYWSYTERAPTVETLMVTHIDTQGEVDKVKSQLIDMGVEMGICMSSEAVHRLAHLGVPRSKLCFIGPAHDGVMSPRPLLVGLTTRLYPDGCKREHLLSELAESLSPDDFRFSIMGSGWDDIVAALRERGFHVEYLDRFDGSAYRNLIPSLDYYLYLGQDEGSMGFLDALAAGVPTIVTPQGFHLDVPGGITHAFSDIGDLRRIFADLASARRRRVEAVKAFTWSAFARRHALVWEYVLGERTGRRVPASLEAELKSLGLQTG